MSVDEGDIVLQRPLPDDARPRVPRTAGIGYHAMFDGMDLRLVERDSATCLAVRGSFDEKLYIGETYDFVNLEGPDGLLVSGEYWDGGESWFIGEWFDPFEATPEVAP